MTPTELADRIAGGEKWAVDIHSCGYHCEKPACMKAQRLELLARLDAAEAAYVEAVRLHNLTLDELRASESENFHADAHKLALALELLLLSTTDDSACAKLWDMAHEALKQHRQLVDETYPQEYVSAFGKD